MNILVIGGAGYIGSHVCKAIAARGDSPVVFDNLSRGNAHAVRWGPLVKGDVRDAAALDSAFANFSPVAVMHFAASAEVEEGEKAPLAFWDNNVGGVIALLQAMRRASCDRLVFSSTCAIYGMLDQLPLTEDRSQMPVNVYGRTKLAVERMLADVSGTEDLRYAALRYFNAAGASPDGEIGEEHKPETHLIPNALKAAAGLGGTMKVFGGDYDTPDGTCIRDYIHVMDLAAAHLAALDRLGRYKGGIACNVGTGQGHSVRDVLEVVEAVTGRPVPYELHDRRPGDPPRLVADVRLSRDLLGFRPVSSDLETIVRTAWNFHRAKWQAAP